MVDVGVGHGPIDFENLQIRLLERGKPPSGSRTMLAKVLIAYGATVFAPAYVAVAAAIALDAYLRGGGVPGIVVAIVLASAIPALVVGVMLRSARQ